MAALAPGPKFVICYLCGRGYGKTSLEIHQKQCKEMWLKREAAKPASKRKPLPEPPEDPQNYKKNDEMLDQYYNEVLVPCPYCARKFLEDRLQVHLRSCGKGKEEAQSRFPTSEQREKEKASVNARPRFVMCYICGREYGSASLDIHQERCKELWVQREAKKPVGQRKPLPDPPSVNPTTGSTRAELDEFNNAAFDAYNSQALYPCENCGRTFKEESLKIHLRSCKVPLADKRLPTAKASNGATPPATKMLDTASPRKGSEPKSPTAKPDSASPRFAAGPPTMYICYICGRQYGSQSVQPHIEKCKQLWIDRQALKPVNERRPVPEPPAQLQTSKDAGGGGVGAHESEAKPMSKDAFNEAAFSAYAQNTLVPCPSCGRKFNEDRLPIHERACKGPSPAKPKRTN